MAYSDNLEKWRTKDRLRKALGRRTSCLRIVYLTKYTRGAAETVRIAMTWALSVAERDRKTILLEKAKQLLRWPTRLAGRHGHHPKRPLSNCPYHEFQKGEGLNIALDQRNTGRLIDKHCHFQRYNEELDVPMI